MKTLTIALTGILLASAPVQGNAQGRGRGAQGAQNTSDNKGAARAGDDRGASLGIAFADVEIRLIREWFSKPANLKGLPPGLAKKESLPPGLQKQLRKDGTLPPGLQKNIQPLPPELEIRLPRLPDDRRRVVISGSVILTDKVSGKIFDILEKVF